MKYRKKPIVVEAFQMTKKRRLDNSEWPAWLHRAWNKDINDEGYVGVECFPKSDKHDYLFVHTKEGPMRIDWNDWIIQGVEGELYPCKSGIFEKVYEKV